MLDRVLFLKIKKVKRNPNTDADLGYCNKRTDRSQTCGLHGWDNNNKSFDGGMHLRLSADFQD